MQAKGVNEFPVDMDKIEWVWYEIDFHVECGQKLRSNHLNIENGAAHSNRTTFWPTIQLFEKMETILIDIICIILYLTSLIVQV